MDKSLPQSHESAQGSQPSEPSPTQELSQEDADKLEARYGTRQPSCLGVVSVSHQTSFESRRQITKLGLPFINWR